jgi:hypothetical protein
MNFSGALVLISLMASSTNAHQQGQPDEEHLKRTLDEDSERFLSTDRDCGPKYFYKAQVVLSSSDFALSCNLEELQTIGEVLDRDFDNVVNVDGALSEMKLRTEICTGAKQPVQRALQTDEEDHREMAIKMPVKYNWGGRGTCRLCKPDNSDRRLLLQDKPDKNRKLRQEYVVIDFNTDGKGNKLTNKNYVRDEWHSAFGMKVTVEDAKGGYAPLKKARIFDSSKPTGYDWDLGTPNHKCPGGGPGIGIGGEPGKPGENCIPQGNLLIVQESNKYDADDNLYGGVIAFTFDSPTRIGHLGILDMEYGRSWLEILTVDDRTLKLNFTGFGENSAQLIHVDFLVKRMKVVMTEAGAVTEIGIFRPTNASEALSRESRSYIAKKSPLAEYLPFLEFDISYYLTTQINDLFGRKAGSCLFGKWVSIDVQLDAVPSLADADC